MASSRQEVVAGLGGALQRYQRSVQAFDDSVGRALGLGATDLRCLDWLADGAKTAGELAAGIGLRPAATTALVDRLSERGLVRRIPSDADRRRVLVEMTPEGQRLTWEAYGPMVSEGQGLFDGIPLTQLVAMGELLDAMRELTDRHRARVQDGIA